MESAADKHNANAPNSNRHTLMTAGGGGLSVDSHALNSGAAASSDLPSGLPANTLNYKYSADHVQNKHGAKKEDVNEPGLDKKVAAASVAALPRYRSIQDVAKANEPE